MKITDLIPDPTLAEEGAWQHYSEDLHVLVAKGNNPRFRSMRNRLLKPYLQQRRIGQLDIEISDDISKRAVAKTVLLGWRGLQDADGNEIPYSPEEALKLLRASEDFYEAIAAMAGGVEAYQAEAREDAEKNLETSSSGTSDSEVASEG